MCDVEENHFRGSTIVMFLKWVISVFVLREPPAAFEWHSNAENSRALLGGAKNKNKNKTTYNSKTEILILLNFKPILLNIKTWSICCIHGQISQVESTVQDLNILVDDVRAQPLV